MNDRLSNRLQRVVDALPLRPGLRVLEIGGAPGAVARSVVARVGARGHVLVLDRSPAGIALTTSRCSVEISAGMMSTLCASVESFTLPAGMAPFDLAFACRVGALDGRHPQIYEPALACIARALTPAGRLFVDITEPLAEIDLRGTKF
jgi:ubiquinone/menaquinone biosynthesis C-methylase UbiE